MKKLIFIITGLFFCLGVYSQSDSTQPPYKRYPTFPPVKLLLPGKTTYFTKDDIPKKTASLLIVFSPMCEHCQHETAEIIKNIDKFKDVEIVMATMMPYDSMMSFREKYELTKYENIVVGQDTQYLLPSFYMIRNLPFLALYDKKKELIRVFEHSMNIEEVIEAFK